MKKTIYMVTMLLAGITVMGAGLSQLTLSMSTQGPDYYADGAPVLVGETYLLVYVNEGAAFAGVKTDGTLVDDGVNKIVTESAAIAGSKCGFKAIQYPPELYPAGGSFVIVLLDTRKPAGDVGGLVVKSGASEGTAAASGDSTKLNSVSVAGTSGGEPVLVASTQSTAPAGTPAPKITSIKGAGQNVELTIGDVSSAAVYEVQSTTDLKSGSWVAAAGCTRLQLSAEGETEVPATVAIPENDKVRFFRVIVPGSN